MSLKSKLRLVWRDACDKPFRYSVYGLQICLAVLFVYQVYSLEALMESSGCRYVLDFVSERGGLP